MKFWQLGSICRERPDILRQVLQMDRWKCYYDVYLEFDELVNQQRRDIIDQILPSDLVIAVLEQETTQLYISGGYLRVRPFGDQNETVTFLTVYKQFGGEVLEEVLEKGLVAI